MPQFRKCQIFQLVMVRVNRLLYKLKQDFCCIASGARVLFALSPPPPQRWFQPAPQPVRAFSFGFLLFFWVSLYRVQRAAAKKNRPNRHDNNQFIRNTLAHRPRVTGPHADDADANGPSESAAPAPLGETPRMRSLMAEPGRYHVTCQSQSARLTLPTCPE